MAETQETAKAAAETTDATTNTNANANTADASTLKKKASDDQNTATDVPKKKAKQGDKDQDDQDKLIQEARQNFDKCVATHSYWAVVDAQSDFEEWADEYYSPEPTVSLNAPIVFGQVTVEVRDIEGMDGECEDEGAGKPTDYSFKVGTEGKSTSLKQFQKALLKFTNPLCEDRKLPFNIYHLKYSGPNTMHLLMGD